MSNFDSNDLIVNNCKFKKKNITVKGEYGVGTDVREIGLTDNTPPHPDLLEERKKLGKIVGQIIELDEATQEKCYVDDISVNRKTGEFSIKISLRIPEIQPNPYIKVSKFNDITRNDAEPLLLEAAMYICGEKQAQSSIDF